MKKLALVALLAAATFAVVLAPEAVAQIRRGGSVPLGTSDTPVRVGGVLQPTNTTLGITIDGGAPTTTAFTVYGATQLGGPIKCGSTAICGSVALSSASPSTATVTVPSGVTCACWPVGTTAAIAAGGCAANVSSTTLTLTGPNTVTTTMRYMCFL